MAPLADGRAKLRVGLLVDGLEQPDWVLRAVREVVASDVAELALLVRNVAAAPAGATLARKLVRERRQLLPLAVARVDERVFAHPADPLAPGDLGPLVRGLPVVDVVPRRTGFVDVFDDTAVTAILAHDLDVAVRFGFRILKGRSLEIARHGVWSWHHGDNLVNRGGPPAYWEVMARDPLTGSILQRLTADLDAGVVLYRSWGRTDPLSVYRNRAALYAKSSAFLIRALRELHATGAPGLLPAGLREACEPWLGYSHRLFRTPSNREIARDAGLATARYAGRKAAARIWREQWTLAYHLDPGAAEPDVPYRTLYRYRRIQPPRDRFWADPFPVLHDGRRYVFLEELIYATDTGHIAVAEVGEDGSFSTPRPVLRGAGHLSYPFVFAWDGGWYLIPESRAERRVALFRAERFPDRWVHERTLLDDVDAVDATLHEHDGRWWMFVNLAAPGASPDDELHLFSATTPLGPWTAHRANPVVSDVRRARPAGRLFRSGGVLHRPAQDGSRRYGWATVIHRVDRLDDEVYAETPVSRLTPDWEPDVRAIHTINAAAGLSVIDLQQRRRR